MPTYSPTNHAAIETWYHTHGRHDLPWRNTQNPYHILLSEVMLQQTQVETVLARFYYPFLERFPDLSALANASLDDVLEYWQGLGYYQRARNLHALAKSCPHGLPNNYEELIALPGIGPNTAHALMAFAYHQPYAVMEANVKRVLSRFYALKTPTQKELFEYAHHTLNKHDPFTHNQAMMDIGALICKPKAPLCAACPLQSECKGQDSPESYPTPKKKTQTPTRNKDIIVAEHEGHIHTSPRESRFLHGLYGFIEIPKGDNVTITGTHIPRKTMQKIGHITQTYSHFKLDADVYYAQLKTRPKCNQWHPISDIQSLPMSMADKKVIDCLEAYLCIA